MARTLTPEIPARELAEFCLHERDELVEGGVVPSRHSTRSCVTWGGSRTGAGVDDKVCRTYSP